MRRCSRWLALGFVLVATSCSAADDQGGVTVLAAASLTTVFEELGTELRDEPPGLEVTSSFGPSSALVEQVLAGAPADVLATADARTMNAAVSGGVVEGDPVVFARNRLTLAVPAGNPGDVSGLVDLERPELRVALCEPQVPCGAAAERLLDMAGVHARPDTLGTDVADVAGTVALDEVDAALIYETDVTDAMDSIDVPAADDVANDYLIAVVADAAKPDGAREFVGAVTGEPGQRILGEAGFVLP